MVIIHQNVSPEEDEAQQASQQTIAEPERKPRWPKKRKVIVVSVNPTEFFDGQKPQDTANMTNFRGIQATTNT